MQFSMDAAKQQLSLEQQLAARRAKKMRRIEQDNAKVRSRGWESMPQIAPDPTLPALTNHTLLMTVASRATRSRA